VDGDDAKRSGGGAGELAGHALELAAPQDALLIEPWPRRVEPHGDEALGAVDRLDIAPDAFEVGERAGKAGRREHRHVVVSRHDEDRPAERA